MRPIDQKIDFKSFRFLLVYELQLLLPVLGLLAASRRSGQQLFSSLLIIRHASWFAGLNPLLTNSDKKIWDKK
jgi:hypothetical protein